MKTLKQGQLLMTTTEKLILTHNTLWI